MPPSLSQAPPKFGPLPPGSKSTEPGLPTVRRVRYPQKSVFYDSRLAAGDLRNCALAVKESDEPSSRHSGLNRPRVRDRPQEHGGLSTYDDFERESNMSIMILPQVHLRKPCYDFYFL